MNEIKIGDKIQDFTLKDQSQKKVHLYDFAGKKVLLSFHPLAWTSVCSEQMKLLEENHEMFDRLNTPTATLGRARVKPAVNPLGATSTVEHSCLWHKCRSRAIEKSLGTGTGNYAHQTSFGFLASWGGCQKIWNLQGKRRSL